MGQRQAEHQPKQTPPIPSRLKLLVEIGQATSVMEHATIEEQRDHDQSLALPGLFDRLADQSAPSADRANEQVVCGSRPTLVGGKAAARERFADSRAEPEHVALGFTVLFVAVPCQGGVDVRAGDGLPAPVAAERKPAQWERGWTQLGDRELDRAPRERVSEHRDRLARPAGSNPDIVQRDSRRTQTVCHCPQLVKVLCGCDRSPQPGPRRRRGLRPLPRFVAVAATLLPCSQVERSAAGGAGPNSHPGVHLPLLSRTV